MKGKGYSIYQFQLSQHMFSWDKYPYEGHSGRSHSHGNRQEYRKSSSGMYRAAKEREKGDAAEAKRREAEFQLWRYTRLDI
jgi:hypothetical protein